MPYCAQSDVESLNAQRTAYGASTRPTATQVGEFIDQIAGEIDSVLASAGIATPAVSPASFVKYLEFTNALGTAALAEMAKFPESDRGQASSPQGDRYWSMYQKRLDALKDGTAIAPDAPTSSAGSGMLARSYLTDHEDNDAATDGSPEAGQPAFSMRQIF